MSDFESFLRWEARSRDTIDFKKAYVDMSGDVVAGLMLSQIVYWYLPNRDGDGKLRVEREGKHWLAKSRDDWWAECRLRPRESDRARKTLESLGIIEVKVFKFNGSPTQHVRMLENRFLELWQKAVDENEAFPRRKVSGGDGEGSGGQGVAIPQAATVRKSLKSPFSRNGEMDFTKRGDGFHRNGEMKITNRGDPRTETTAEITSKTTAAAGSSTDADAAAGLIQELVSHGVGRAVAEQYARQTPDRCRKYLAYLPYAKLRTTAGAWFANAIRDEYGPPEGYLKAKQESKRRTVTRQAARQTPQEELCRKKLARLTATYEQMEKSNGDALAAFNAYVGEERSRVAHVARGLTEKRRDRLVASFDDPGRRLELFERWLALSRSNVVRESDGAGFQSNDAT